MRGATPSAPVRAFALLISIHAPRAGRDPASPAAVRRAIYFNPRAPCGARRGNGGTACGSKNFNPRAPCGARHSEPGRRPFSCRHFNPRAPCGARLTTSRAAPSFSLFQSTRPVRGATSAERRHAQQHDISIHAPRAGRDKLGGFYNNGAILFQSTRPVRGATRSFPVPASLPNNFNPRAPCGARPRLAP